MIHRTYNKGVILFDCRMVIKAMINYRIKTVILIKIIMNSLLRIIFNVTMRAFLRVSNDKLQPI